MNLPLRYFWSMGKAGRRRSYFNSRKGMWEDVVEIKDGIAHYYLLGNWIASFNGRELELSTAGYETMLTWSRLSAIIEYGESLGYKIPLRPKMRKSNDGDKIYWLYGDRAVLPKSYPIKIDILNGEILTEMRDVIPSFVIRPSRSKKENAEIKLRKNNGKYIIRNGVQYLELMGRLYIFDRGLWVRWNPMDAF